MTGPHLPEKPSIGFREHEAGRSSSSNGVQHDIYCSRFLDGKSYRGPIKAPSPPVEHDAQFPSFWWKGGMQVSEKKASQFERSICERLIEQGKLDQQGLQRAQRLQAESGERLYALLPKLGLVSERDVAETLAACLALPLANGNDFPDEPMFEGRLSSRFLGDSLLLPLSQEAEGLRVAMADPLDDYASNAIRLIAKSDVLRCVAEPAELEAAIDRLYRKKASGARADETDISGADKDSDLELDVERLKDLASEAPVIRLVNQLINQAIDARASDIHIEPFDRGMRVR